jgi:protein-tyrosine kinase
LDDGFFAGARKLAIMSRFFNETRKALQQERAASNGSGPMNLDVQEAVDALKSDMEKEVRTAPVIAATNLGPLLGALERTSEIGAQVAAARLEKCRTIRLPRHEEKSFLAAQYNPSMQAAVEAYRSLRTRLVKRQTEQGTRSMVITSAEQGEGKTLTSLNLGLCYANIQNWPVLLVDADLRTRGLSRLIGDPDSPGLGQVLESGCPYESGILATSTPNLYVLPAGEASTPPPELFASLRWKEFVGWCGESFKLMIIDAPPVLDLADFELITAQCESVLLIVRARKTHRESLNKIKGQLDPKKLVGVVVNSSESDHRNGYYRYGYGYGYGQEKKPAERPVRGPATRPEGESIS